jgi:hypothetical protein
LEKNCKFYKYFFSCFSKTENNNFFFFQEQEKI